MKGSKSIVRLVFGCGALLFLSCCATLRGSGDLGLVVEREKGSLLVVETTGSEVLGKVEGLGDLSHASIVYSRDGRYGYVFGRDGGLTKVDLLKAKIDRRVIQAGNSIGGAISQDGRLIAVSNYEPGGVKIFDSENLELVADIVAQTSKGERPSKVVGLVDAPGQRFVFSLFDGGEIWVVDMSNSKTPLITKLPQVGDRPYDGLVSSNGRYYMAGLFGEEGIALVDLWNLKNGVRRILPTYSKADERLPVYKMPHLEGWALTDDLAFLPAVGREELWVADRRTWKIVKKIALHGQPVFAMASPDDRQVWVNFAFPKNDHVQVIDVSSLNIVQDLKPGKGVLHMEFTPRGERVWVSVRDENQLVIYDTRGFEILRKISADRPSGIFFTSRSQRIGL